MAPALSLTLALATLPARAAQPADTPPDAPAQGAAPENTAPKPQPDTPPGGAPSEAPADAPAQGTEPTSSPAPASSPAPGPSDEPGEASGEDEADDAALSPDSQEVAQLYFAGRVAYDTGNYDRAIERFEQAYAKCLEIPGCHAPAMQYNLAQAFWKRGEIAKSVEDLRRAKELFTNYDRTMAAAEEDYDGTKVKQVLAALDAKIEYLELAAQAQAARETRNAAGPQAPIGPTAEEMRLQQRLKTTKALHASGTALIVLGSLSAVTALAALIGRGATKFMLDQSGGGEAGKPNQLTPEDDRKNRNAYAMTGKVSFAMLLTTGVLLPVGITLKVAAKIRDKEDGILQHRVDEKRRLREQPVAASFGVGSGLLRIEF